MPELFSKVVKDKRLTDLDEKIEKLLGKIPKQFQKDTESDKVGDVVETFLNFSDQGEVERLLQNVSVPRTRLARYSSYDEMNQVVPIIKKILKVYIANLLPKNPVDSKTLLYRVNSDTPADFEKYEENVRKFIKDIVSKFDLLKKLKETIIPKRLLYGDVFVEVVNLLEETDFKLPTPSTVTTSVFVESKINEFDKSMQTNGRSEKFTNNALDRGIQNFSEMLIEFSDSSSIFKRTNTEDKDESENGQQTSENNDNDKKKKAANFENLLLKIHEPRNIVILQTKYGEVLGYLEVFDSIASSVSVPNQLGSLFGKLSTAAQGKADLKQEDVINKIIFYMLRKITDSAKKSHGSAFQNVGESLDDIVQSFDQDVYNFIKRIVIEQGLDNNKKFRPIKVRFISPGRMVQFTNPSTTYAPYGESVVENLILPSKLYLLSQLANSISKLSRASLIRKWTVDVGSTQMHSQLIQKLQRELYNTRITLNDLQSFKNIPKILSDYKDMFVFTKQGQTPLDVSVESHGDRSIDVADLEDARREIISLSGIPATYLGYADQMEMREQLVHTNVAFATEITDMQEQDNKGISQIIDIIAEDVQIGFVPSNYINVTLIPPVILILQLIEMTLSSIGNMTQVFQGMGIKIDPYYLLEQYVPHIDWQKFKEKSIVKDLEDITKRDMGGSGEDMMGGGMGGGMY